MKMLLYKKLVCLIAMCMVINVAIQATDRLVEQVALVSLGAVSGGLAVYWYLTACHDQKLVSLQKQVEDQATSIALLKQCIEDGLNVKEAIKRDQQLQKERESFVCAADAA